MVGVELGTSRPINHETTNVTGSIQAFIGTSQLKSSFNDISLKSIQITTTTKTKTVKLFRFRADLSFTTRAIRVLVDAVLALVDNLEPIEGDAVLGEGFQASGNLLSTFGLLNMPLRVQSKQQILAGISVTV